MEYFNIIFSAAIVVIGLVFIYLAVRQMRQSKEAEETWVKAPGTVLDSKLDRHRSQSSSGGMSSTKYTPRVSYQYQAMGQTYTGDRLGFGSAAYNLAKAEKMIAAYPKDGQVTVYYNPADPSKAVLETKAIGKGNYLVLGIMLLACGVLAWMVLPR